MRRALKILAILFGSLIALSAIAVAVVVNLDFDDYKYLVEAEARERTGRDLQIRGRLDVDLSLQPSVTMTDVRFANAPWGSAPEMAALEHLSATIDLWPFLTDNVIDVQNVDIRGLDLLVEKNRDGQTNLEFRELKTRKEAKGPSVEGRPSERAETAFNIPILRDVRLADIRVQYNDLGFGENRNLVVDRLTIGGDGPFQPLKIALDGKADEIPLNLSGELGSPSEMLNPDRIWTVDLQGDLAGTKLTLAGGIDEPAAGRGINIIFSTETAEVGTLSRITEPLAGQTIPDLGPLKLSLLLSGSADEALSASDILVKLGRSGGLQFQLSGAVADILSQDGVDLKGDISIPDVASMSRITGQSIPAFGSLNSKFSISGSAGSGIALDDFAFELARSGVLRVAGNGTVADLITQRGVDLRVNIMVPSIKALPALNGDPLPDAGRVEASFALAGNMPQALAIKDLKASLGQKDVYQLVLEGGIADLMNQAGIDLGFEFSTPDLARLSTLAQAELPAMAPIKASGRMKGGATEVASIENLVVGIGESDLSGQVAVADMATRPNISADFRSNVLRLQDITPKSTKREPSGGGGNGNASAKKQGGGEGRVIPNDPIDLSALRMIDADIAVAVAKLVLPRGQFQDGQLELALQDGVLTVEPVSLLDDKGGKLTGKAKLDARREAADLVLDVRAEQLEVSNLMRLAGQHGIIEGPLEMALAMTSKGRSPRELAAGLTGEFNAAVTEGYVNSDETRKAFGKATQVIADLLLGNSKEKRIPLYCFVADYKAKNGVVTTDSLVLDTKVSTILSSGSLDLGTEELNLTVTPTREVMGLGAEIPVRVQGSFAKPRVYPDPALAAAGIGSALLGVPLIPLEMLGDAVSANDNDSPCVNLRPENRQQQTQPQQTEQKADPKKQLEDAGKKAIGNILKNVFPQD